MEQILEYITRYGLSVFVIASCIIALIGILKLCKLFDKIKNKNVKKLIYYILNVAFSFGGAAIYFAIFKIDFSNYVMYSCTQVGATTTLYAIYENFGVRKLVQMGLAWIATWFKKNPENKFVKALKGLGLNEEAITNIQAVTTAELEKAKVQKLTAPETVEVIPAVNETVNKQ